MGRQRAYSIESPLGDIRFFANGDIPVGISLTGDKGVKSEKGDPPPKLVLRLMHVVEDYFQGRSISDKLAETVIEEYMDLSPFAEAVMREVIHIPKGETLPYGEVAAMAGSPGAARAVGNIMNGNTFPIIIPCHRVIKCDGTTGGFGEHPKMKIWLLGFEGAPVTPK
jgi:methylated-DNA-[protein]-cysteine S-methyltransferase